jgi:hypothetical protein
MPKTTKKKKSAAVLHKPVVVETKAAPTRDDLSQFPAFFENKAGRYELIRVDGGQAYYSFTNRQHKTVDATMSVVTWRKMQERAEAALKESA